MSNQLTHLSLFSGIGGLDLAAEWAGFKTVGQCEWAEYPTKVLEKHWPNVPKWRDVRDVSGKSVRERTGVDCITVVSGGGFHANPIPLQENVWRLMMSAIYGTNYLECFAKLMPDGLWEKMFQGCSQVRMEGFLGESLKIWPKSGVMRGGTAFQPTLVELNTSGKEFALWPRPIASDGEAWEKSKKCDPMSSIRKCWENGKQDRTIYYHIQKGLNPNQAADLNGMMMGFPEGWTD